MTEVIKILNRSEPIQSLSREKSLFINIKGLVERIIRLTEQSNAFWAQELAAVGSDPSPTRVQAWSKGMKKALKRDDFSFIPVVFYLTSSGGKAVILAQEILRLCQILKQRSADLSSNEKREIVKLLGRVPVKFSDNSYPGISVAIRILWHDLQNKPTLIVF